MNTDSRNILLAFALTSPEDVISGIRHKSDFIGLHSAKSVVSSGMSEDYYVTCSRKLGKNYSIDEVKMMYREMKSSYALRSNIPKSVFQLLIEMDLAVLKYDSGKPICQRNQLMRFRELSLVLGQDIFTMSFLAYLTFERKIPFQRSFNWGTKIETDDYRLKCVLRKGIAENHFHLGGSTPIFSLSWVTLMNHPQRINKYFSDFYESKTPFEEQRSETVLFSDNDYRLSWNLSLRYAAWIRAMLFEYVYNNIPLEANEILNCDPSFVDAPELNQKVSKLRLLYGCCFEQPDQTKKCLDYALIKNDIYFDYNSSNRLLCGERALLYRCFLACFSGKMSDEGQNMFYLYLLLKSRFRSELVQVNRDVGFANFSIYQGRKATFWKDIKEYWVESRRLTVNSALENGMITSLELRLQPQDTANAIIQDVQTTDECILFADNKSVLGNNLHPISSCSELDKVEFGLKMPFFYVFHFIKRQISSPKQAYAINEAMPRNAKERENAKMRSLALASALEKSSYLCTRVRGIDAASFEIGCRPETFATEFRFLKSFVPSESPFSILSSTNRIKPRLGITYHVGEDFLDIVDGLRAIDESIRFLHLSRGDRLGHALALGVDPKIHYSLKEGMAILSKQDVLDNCVWMLKRSTEFGILIEPNLRELLKSRAKQLIVEIYGKCIYKNHLNVTLDDYFSAWKLRGDHPECYQGEQFRCVLHQHGRFTSSDSVTEKYHSYYLDDACDDFFRHQNNVFALLHAYHYGYDERIEGLKPCKVDITYEYKKLVADLQKHMRQLISESGIAIECNLSSNQLIGTFGDFLNHPILCFNNHHLSNQSNSNNISVSINTDDQGVFDTSLENEYAILVETLSLIKDENNNRLYSDDVIYKYVDYVRSMGASQVFPTPMQ